MGWGNEVKVARAGKDFVNGDRVIITGNDFVAYLNEGKVSSEGGKVVRIIEGFGQSGYLLISVPTDQKIKVIIEHKMLNY
jgi:hypothetical protein